MSLHGGSAEGGLVTVVTQGTATITTELMGVPPLSTYYAPNNASPDKPRLIKEALGTVLYWHYTEFLLRLKAPKGHDASGVHRRKVLSNNCDQDQNC